MEAKANPAFQPRPKIFDEFALTDRVGLVSGGNRGIGLELAIVLCEAGARAVYCFDLPEEPSEEFVASREYVSKLGDNSRLEYISADVRNQELLWKKAEEIGDKEQRMDICIAAAGICETHTDCLEFPGKQVREVHGKNTGLIKQVSLTMIVLGHGREHGRCSVYGPGGWSTDGTFWQWRQYNTDRFDVWKYYEQGKMGPAH